MFFLVRLTIDLPDALRDPEDPERRRLLAAELERGLELRDQGVIVSIWRVHGGPGLRNVGIWRSDDEATLHKTISSLPLSRWMTVEVTAVTEHPVEKAYREGREAD